MKTTLNHLLSFLKAPYLPETYIPIKPKTFLILLVLTLAIIIPYALILEAAGMDQFDHKLEELLKDNKWVVAIAVIFLAPLLEEPIFRLHLDLKKSSIWWGIGLSVLMLGEVWWPVAMLWVYLFFLLLDIPLYSTPRFRCKVRHPFHWKGRQYSAGKVATYSASKLSTLMMK